MNINGEEYELIKVYPDDKNELKDMLLFNNKNGYKECFHRFDLIHASKIKKIERAWSDYEDEELIKALKTGKSLSAISKSNVVGWRTPNAIYERAKKNKTRNERGENK